jgi:hypothetical protein
MFMFFAHMNNYFSSSFYFNFFFKNVNVLDYVPGEGEKKLGKICYMKLVNNNVSYH